MVEKPLSSLFSESKKKKNTKNKKQMRTVVVEYICPTVDYEDIYIETIISGRL